MRPARVTMLVCAAGAPLALAALAGPVAATPAPAPAIHPARFTSQVDNPWFPLLPGSVYRYRGTKDGKSAVDTVEVTRRTRLILSVPTVVVRDRLELSTRQSIAAIIATVAALVIAAAALYLTLTH